MTYYPRFQVGENKLNAELLNRVMAMLQWYEGQYRKLELKKPERYEPRARSGLTLGRVGVPQLFAPNRWRYAWSRSTYNPLTDTFEDSTGGTLLDQFALNIAEFQSNATTGPWGQPLLFVDGTLTVNPVAIDQPALFFPVGTPENRVWLFDATNPMTPECTE